ncbi:type I site-specific deoxyribonuclease HsdR family subfamily [Clostridium perfringens]|uniref:type I restriction endonuclease subunit R n=1 Tax=Clostridium perfringens TaxID=1502 RepID=UPI000D902248|nr:type I restriction endonuclease subunit R [Clostridium perfringens]MDG6887174.1 Type-1 restriction enzyme R protein [Clostridium perfringens]SQB23961.1 type I site-specific deoxyribonuclease HsdR family subfamily [Clostridium perfringens]STB61844.1 type I site-specific deoxyribonuclease HsdR family subfamily [Clostridium perfringens]HAT4275645.1 type I restriction endonuclease subunit R [Clostridium perfringens]HBI7028223.1 type I restriction endonuclease subunit R [Clostridium perfringens]
MTYQSEHELEELLINQLVEQGYAIVNIPDEAALEKNFRETLFEFNRKKLGGAAFTDKEFERILIHLKNKSIFNSAKIFRDKFILERENGTKVYIEFFDGKDYHNNIFQVSNQITMEGKYVNRYDVTILINGLPMVQIELKRRGKDFYEAFDQIERYRRHSLKGLFRYIQCFVISNGVDTKYYSNSDKEIKREFTFFWSDEKNKRVTNLREFAESFLDRNMLNKIIARYMIINESEKNLMVMRPYQIYAVEALMKRANETNNNGFIWHTTGSGKTLTSFKASQLLADEDNVKKVFFLIDRKDLDSQTVEEFNKFEKDCVDTTDNVRTLIKQIEDVNTRLIVTTIQKLARLLKSEKYAHRMDKYRDEKVIFIIDECHRSQFGEMHTAINKYFTKAQYFGFTGTPRLPENRSQDGRTTADIFDKCLHNYLIKDAINDGNVLGFSVEYIKTFDGEVNEYDDEYIKAIDKEEVFMNDERIENIAKDIIANHDKKTAGRKFCSLFTVQKIPMLVKYYDAFKALEHDLKIAAIFTYDDNENLDGKCEHSRESLDRIISDYNKMFKEEDIDFSTDTFKEYSKHLSKKIKNAEVDIVIVVNMFLTGFDSKPLNTLYVDKNLKYHGLIQAYSRTNRILDGTKQHGNIVCYRNLKKETDEAICLFSQTDSTDVVLMESFDHYLKLFQERLDRLYETAPTIESIDSMQDENEKKDFVEAFRELTKQLTKLKTFVEFEFNEKKLGISAQKYEDYKSKYFAIYESVKKDGKTSVLVDIDFCIELMQTDKINVNYILNLIRTIDFETEEKTKKDIEKIKRLLDNADNENLRLKSELLREFLDQVVPNITKNDSVDEAFNEFLEDKRVDEIEYFSNEVEIDKFKVKEYVSEYEYSGRIDGSEIKDNLSGGLLKKKRLAEKIKTFIINHVTKFNF